MENNKKFDVLKLLSKGNTFEKIVNKLDITYLEMFEIIKESYDIVEALGNGKSMPSISELVDAQIVVYEEFYDEDGDLTPDYIEEMLNLFDEYVDDDFDNYDDFGAINACDGGSDCSECFNCD